MADPRFLAEHIRLAMIDAGIDPGVPTVDCSGGECIIRYPGGDESRWGTGREDLAQSAEVALRQAYELALILTCQQKENP